MSSTFFKALKRKKEGEEGRKGKRRKKEEIFVVRLYKRRLVFGTRNATDN